MVDQALQLRRLIKERSRWHSEPENVRASIRVVCIVTVEEDSGSVAIFQVLAMLLAEGGYRVAVLVNDSLAYSVRAVSSASKLIRSDQIRLEGDGVERLAKLETGHDFLLVRLAALPVSAPPLWALISDLVILATPFQKEPLVKAYSWLKLLYAERESADVMLLVHRAQELEKASALFQAFGQVVERFLNVHGMRGGVLPMDPYFQGEYLRGGTETTLYPLSRAVRAFKLICESWFESPRPSVFAGRGLSERVALSAFAENPALGRG